jgi:glycosyltransferase involved in cell wall biosynthesis
VAGVAFPHKVLQYMAVGIPVVSTKLDGLHTAFSDTSGITWVEDESQVAEKCLDLLNTEPQNSEQIRHLQLLTVKKLFSVQSTVSALESTLFALVKEREKK